MSISMNEILKNRAKLEELPQEIQDNLKVLLERINKIRSAYGKPMKVNDGLRIKGKHDYGSAKSNHYKGLAIDIDDDESGTFWFWIMNNLKLIQEVGLWLEHGCWTHHKNGTWVHLQIVPPASKKRIFVPSASANPNPKFWDGKYDPKYDK